MITKQRFLPVLWLVLLAVLSWMGGARGNPLVSQDLASETEWQLSVDGEPSRAIKVPFGGWNSDRQSPRISETTDVKDHVVYSRSIQIPAEAAGQVTKLVFGAVNYGADILLDGKLIATHVGPFTAFEVDVTDKVQAGKSYALQVKAYTLNHYNRKNRDLAALGKMKEALETGDITVPTGYIYLGGYTKLGHGIGRSVKLQVFPGVYVKDVFVRPSVSNQSLSYDLWIENRSAHSRKVSLKSSLASWNMDSWKYPSIGDLTVTVEAGQCRKITAGPIPWTLGAKSYWWPNVPFKEDYVAKLHYLNLSLNESGKPLDIWQQRFGFVEHAEGPYYYTVNGVRLNLPSDATAITQGSVYDGYAEAAAFKAPTGPGTGCAETWKRYMRLGIRANRSHQEPPTEYILSVADEVGFVLIPESAIRGSYLPQSHDPKEPGYASHLREMVEQCRNHPSVARYSLSNEMGAIPELIDYAAPYDATRPLVYESNGHNKSTRVETSKGHAYTIAHYCAWPRPARQIFGMGEYAWSTDGMADYATQGKDMRLNDVCYFSGWSWLNYWPNFLEGMNHATYAWKQNNHADRTDGVDGWGSPLVKYVQTALHPYLIMDQGIERIAPYTPDWPGVTPTIKPGSPFSRSIEIFNDGLFGNRLTFRWSAHWDSPIGDKIAEGNKDLQIEPGFHATEKIDFAAPAIGPAKERHLFLVMESIKEGKVVFREDRIHFRISAETPIANAEFLGEDATTGGTWKGKYGRDGYDLAGAQMELPGYANLSWQDEGVHTWQKGINDKRALQYFVNDGNLGFSRLAAKRGCRGIIQLTVDVGERYHQVALYFLDWENQDQSQKIVVRESGIEQTVKAYRNGKYLLFKVRGKVTFLIDSGGQSEISGVFFDPIDGESISEDKTRIDDRDRAIQYSGTWKMWEGNGGYMNTETYTSAPGAEASLTFTGTRVRWFGFKRWDMGQAEVYLDGQLKGTVDCYGVSLQRLILFQSEALSAGQHTITVRVKGEKNPASAGAQVIVDAFEYFNGQSIPHGPEAGG